MNRNLKKFILHSLISSVLVIFLSGCTTRDNNDDSNRMIPGKMDSENVGVFHPDASGTDSIKIQLQEQLNREVSSERQGKIDFKIFKKTDGSGYGYDILIDGKLYVHQPNIPAVQGNRGFASREEAKKVAELMVKKINRKIIPPAVSLSELDSMGIILKP